MLCCSVLCFTVLCCVQAVFGLERLVDSTIARKVPSIAYGTTIAIRFVNNVIGEQHTLIWKSVVLSLS